MEIFAYILLVFALAFLAWTIFKHKGGGCSCSGTCTGGGCCKRQRREEGGECGGEKPKAGK